MSLFPETTAAALRYDRQRARWRHVVDWIKHRHWMLRLIEPLSRGRGRFRFTDDWFPSPPPAPVRPDLRNWNQQTLAATWLGHATILLRFADVTILTDPVFSTRVGPGWGFGTLGPARAVRPALMLRELPPIDLILSSHAHFDHLDRPALSRLARRRTTVVCAANTRDLFDDLGFGKVIELKTGERTELAGLRIESLAARHWGARMVLDGQRGFGAYLLETNDHRILFGGDTAHQDFWKPIGERGGVDLAIVGIGAYDPWIGGHANPEQAWSMAMDAGARRVLPMHHSTFKLSVEPMDDPLRRFLIAAGERGDDVVCRRIGGTWRLE